MIEIDNTIVSFDVVKTFFKCDITICKGKCCIEGDSGAPLEEEEIKLIEKNINIISEYLSDKSKKVITENNFYYIDSDGDLVTQLCNNKECVFVYFENEIAYCAIEKAYTENKINFNKPISCQLYPIRLTKYKDFTAVNYHQWAICEYALINGKNDKIYLYQFCKNALCNKFGSDWYNKLADIATYIKLKEI
jgi:hypothetical protein